MIHHHIRDVVSFNQSNSDAIATFETVNQIKAFKKIQMFVLITISVLLLQLGHLMKPNEFGILRLMSQLSCTLAPVLIPYILGLMGQLMSGSHEDTLNVFHNLTCQWAILLLFAYAEFDNLNAFIIEKRSGRLKLVLDIGTQYCMLILILYQFPAGTIRTIPIFVAFVILTLKFVERVIALSHSAGASHRIQAGLGRVIKYMDQDVDGTSVTNPITMEGYNYLVGSRYSRPQRHEEEEGGGLMIVDGVTVEKIWSTEGLSNMELKDTCLSFALFWLLLGKFRSYPLYSTTCSSTDEDEGFSINRSSSRNKAWKLVRHGLLAENGDHERVFRVIDTEIDFLHDYFHAKFIFFYLNGFYWKFINVIFMPPIFWWFFTKVIDYQALNTLSENGFGDFSFTIVANKIVISVIMALEAIQLIIFLNSKWVKVTLYCFYVKRRSKHFRLLTHVFLEVIRFIFLGSSCTTKGSRWRKPWKRELDQCSLIKSSISSFWPSRSLWARFSSFVGVTVEDTNFKRGKKVELSEEVKEAVVLCLQRNNTSPELSNGVQSLRRNGLPELAYSLSNNDTESILVWHIATILCDFHQDGSSDTPPPTPSTDMKVAIHLSNYCGYLLFLSPSLLNVPILESKAICNSVIEDARMLLNNPISISSRNSCIYERLIEFGSCHEEGGGGNRIMRKGIILGTRLISQVSDSEARWKILAEFWAEMILYLAPSDNNETAHAETISEGGEFITQLWVLLIHAGITNRNDMVAAFQHDDGDA